MQNFLRRIGILIEIVAFVITGHLNLSAQEYVFEQQADEWGLVVMEAEHYTDMILRGADYFETVTEPEFYSGDGAMMAVGLSGAYANGSDALAGSPFLTYVINFIQADTVYIWVRGSHESGGDDSFHAGLDGVITAQSERIGYHGAPYSVWTWLGINMVSAKPFVLVDSPGLHQFEIYIRENGCKHDKFVLTTSKEYDPFIIHGEFGPDETLMTAIDQPESGVTAQDYRLNQNYPNPFNPETTISYNLPRAEHVLLRIYNLQGEEITTLVNELKSNGQHGISWDGKNINGSAVASGVYIYRIMAGNFVQSNKMLLVR